MNWCCQRAGTPGESQQLGDIISYVNNASLCYARNVVCACACVHTYSQSAVAVKLHVYRVRNVSLIMLI